MMVMGNLLINNWNCFDTMTVKETTITFNKMVIIRFKLSTLLFV